MDLTVLDQNHPYKKGLRKEKDFIAMDGCPLHTSFEACLAQFLWGKGQIDL